NRQEGTNVGTNRVKCFANFERLRSTILVDQSDFRITNLAAKGISQHDQLDQGKYHRHQHESVGAKEFAHFELDDSKHSDHDCNPGRGGMTKACALTNSSRSCRPV